MQNGSIAEAVCRWLLCLYLLWIPLPFGSVITLAQFPLVAVPILLSVVALIDRFWRSRQGRSLTFTMSFVVFVAAAVLLISTAIAQQVPLPAGVVEVLSPTSADFWKAARRASELSEIDAGGSGSAYLSVAPSVTRLHLMRVLGYLGVFLVAAFCFRRRGHRLILAATLGAGAIFQVVYGLKQFTASTGEIWGWRNLRIHDRVTGTFVNPNHFAHYLAIVLPIVIYVVISCWVRRRRLRVTLPERIARFLEGDVLPVGLATAAGVVALGGVLVSKSRGALLATFVGVVVCVSLLVATRQLRPESVPFLRRFNRLGRFAGIAALVILVISSLVFFIGVDRTVRRFVPTGDETLTLVGRTHGMSAAIGVWREFPVVGSGLGTFDDVVLMTQSAHLDRIFTHAHNDYLEILATTGLVGFIPAFTGLICGWLLMLRDVVRRPGPTARDDEVTWGSDDGRLFATAAFASLTAAMVHALFDFNFFIPANPATLAAIVGAAVAIPSQVKRAKADDVS